MKLLRVVAILSLVLVGILRLQRPAMFVKDSVFRVGAKATEVVEAVGAQPDYKLRGPEEADFWLKNRGCAGDDLRAVSKIWIYQRHPRNTVALGVDTRGIVRCVDFSWAFITIHV